MDWLIKGNEGFLKRELAKNVQQIGQMVQADSFDTRAAVCDPSRLSGNRMTNPRWNRRAGVSLLLA
jgi:hypothetical protein